MLDYFVTSAVRRRLVLLLFGTRTVSGSAGQLAKRARVAFSHAHDELKEMYARGWLKVTRDGTREVYSVNALDPQTALISQLVKASEGSRAQERSGAHAESLLANLRALGAPLGGIAAEPLKDRDAVAVLAEGTAYSRRDPSVARSLPIAVWAARSGVTRDKLTSVSARPEDKHAFAFMLDLAGELGGDRHLCGLAEVLRDGRFRAVRPYFYGDKKSQEFPLARKWGFSMNADQASFETLFTKFVKTT